MKTKLLLCSIILAGMQFMSNAQLQAQNPCQAGFTPSINATTVVFTNTSTGAAGITNYSWNFGDGNYATTATLQTQTHIYAYNGIYTACLFMSDSGSINAGCYSTFCDTIIITGGTNPPCHAAFSYYVDSSNTSPGVSFYDQSSYAVNWSWNFGDGNTSTQQNPIHQYANAGTYSVCLTIINSFHDTCSYCSSVNYYPCTLLAGFTFNNANDPQVVFTNTSTGGYAPYYYWDFGDGNNSSLTNVMHTYQYSGTYIVCMYANDSLSSCHASHCDTIIITHAPPQPCNANFYDYLDSANTPSNTVSFYDASTGGPTTWLWNFGDGNTSTLQNPVHQYAQTGTYSVCLTISTPAGTCSYCNSVVVNIINPISCSAGLSILPDSTNSLLWYVYPTVTGTAPFTYFWDFGDGNTSTLSSPTHTYAQAGHYNICLTITDATGCTSSTCDSTYRLIAPTVTGGIMKYVNVVNATGIEEISLSVNSIFPNPSKDIVEVSLNQSIAGELKIIDMTGREVYREKINTATMKINVSNLSVGLYNLSIISGTKMIHSKIMIAR